MRLGEATRIYATSISHARSEPVRHRFQDRSHTWLVDLDDLPQLGPLQPLVRFEARDHLGDPAHGIRENLEAFLATEGVDLRGGQVLMLAMPRVLGSCFNPITVFWCRRPDDTLECVVAEVHNTYGERHCYLLSPDDAGRARATKDFYVSPFLTVDGEYRMHLPMPDERLSLAITLRQNGSMALVATVAGERRSAAPGSLVRMLARRPLVTLRTSALIRRHGVALWLRRLPVIPRPRHAPQEGVQ